MNKKRLLSSVFLFLLLLLPAYSKQGKLWGTKELRVTQTQWFDIIYAEQSEPTAALLYAHADDIYSELAASYGVEPSFRMPVVITSGVEQFNAYFSFFPYNHIVIYDTAVIPDLAVFSETLLSVFTHELTHVLTYNLRSPLYIGLSKVFGDPFNMHYFTITSGMAEGATLAYESSKGEGRLNDPYALQMVRQAKIEGKFPSYSDVKGASDAYPANSFYYFNGSFAQYLQQEYGMQKYAEFWYRCVNFKNLSVAGAFKKVYGLKLSKAWKNFEDSVYIPQLSGSANMKEFYLKGVNNQAGSRFTNLCYSPQGIYYLDMSTSCIYFIPKEQLQSNSTVHPKKVLGKDYIDSITVSADGRFLTVSFYSFSEALDKHKSGIYDLQQKKWIPVNQTNIVNPCVISDSGEYYFVYQSYQAQRYSIQIQKLDLSARTPSLKPHSSKAFNNFEVPTAFTDLSNGNFAFIKQSGLDFSICVSNCDFSSILEYSLPESGMRISALNITDSLDEDIVLSFSWATKQTMPRLGIVKINLEQQEPGAQFQLSSLNFSGGVYSPVVLGDRLFYSGEFYKDSRFLTALVADFCLIGESAGAGSNGAGNGSSSNGDTRSNPLPYTSFNSSPYFFKGFLIPVSLLQNDNSISNRESKSYMLPFGFTYYAALPWDATALMLSGGYGITSKSGGLGLQYSNGTHTTLFNYAINSLVEFDQKGFRQANGNLSASTGVDFGKISYAGLTLDQNLLYGRISLADNTFVKSKTSLSATYTNRTKTGPGTYERGGMALSVVLTYLYEKELAPKPRNISNFADLGIGLNFYIPKLIPVTCRDNFTYNLPTKLNTSAFTYADSASDVFVVQTHTILFGVDIQKAVPLLSCLYLNDLILTLDYTGYVNVWDQSGSGKSFHIFYLDKYYSLMKNGKMNYIDYATAKLSIGFTPNIGSFASSAVRNNFYLSYSFGKKENLPKKVFNLGLEAKF